MKTLEKKLDEFYTLAVHSEATLKGVLDREKEVIRYALGVNDALTALLDDIEKGNDIKESIARGRKALDFDWGMEIK